MTPIEEDLQERKHHRKVVWKNRIKLGLQIGIPLLIIMVVVFNSIITPWINSVAPIVQQNTIKATRNTVAEVASTNFSLGNFPSLPAYLGVIAAVCILAIIYLFPFYQKWKLRETVEITLNSDEEDEEEDEGGEHSANVKKRQITLDPFTPEEGQQLRLVICTVFHTILGLVAHLLLQELVYNTFPAWITGLTRFFYWGALLASVWSCFDSSSIDPNHAAEMKYFGRFAWSNIKQGFFCYGIPPWLGAEIEVVDFGEQMITIGHVDGKKIQFIVECRGFRAIFDIAFSVCANNTRIVIKLRGDLEKQLVTAVNEVVYRLVNRKATKKDAKGRDLLDEHKTPILLDPIGKDENGEPIYKDAYPDIGTLKSSTAELSYLLLKEKPDTRNKSETAPNLLNRLGHELISVYVKDIENEDKSIINAQQELEARKLLEKAEMLNIRSTADKVDFLYAQWNPAGEPEKVTKMECLKVVERQEGGRKTYEGLGKTFTGIPGA